MLSNDNAYKLERTVSDLCKFSENNGKIPVIIFTDKENKPKLREHINALGGKIRYELEILGAYAAEVDAKHIGELINYDTVNYIASDTTAYARMDCAKRSVRCDTHLTGKGVTAAVIDTGIYPHDDLIKPKNRIREFADFVNGKKKPYDDNGHGTHVAGIIASGGVVNEKYRGIAPECEIVAIKALNEKGEGKLSDILAAMNWVWQNHKLLDIKILSLSLGTENKSPGEMDPLIKAAEKLWDAGITVVAAAGNSGPKHFTIDSPASSPKLITVGSCDTHHTPTRRDDTVSEFSSRGPSQYTRYKPDILAPGDNIRSLKNSPGGYDTKSGTSMATPIVSAACALLLEKEPDLTPDMIKRRIRSCAYNLGYPMYDQGCGILDIKKLLR
ncbi:MAG: S8 family peptidase [Eubacteriaceae bacterium]|nr:S8 family peptidase [Eubacteriaceae bacterium]